MMLRNQFPLAAALILLAPAVALAQRAPVATTPGATTPVATPSVATPSVATPSVTTPSVATAPGTNEKNDADDKLKKAADDKLKKATDDAAAAKTALEELRAGKFLTSGITGGVAFAVQIPGPSNYTPEQTSVRGVVMPYVLVFPAYWRTPETTRVACASAWSAASEKDTDTAALGIAQARAGRFFEAIAKTLGANPTATSADVVDQLGLEYGSTATNESIVDRVRDYLHLPKDGTAKDGTAKDETAKDETAKDSIIAWMARMEWHAGRTASCWHKRIGFWVGIPANYEANTKVNEKAPVVARTIKPVIAFGLGYSPNQYVSLLAGFTAASVTDGATALDRTIWATTIALGGNLDIASSLVK